MTPTDADFPYTNCPGALGFIALPVPLAEQKTTGLDHETIRYDAFVALLFKQEEFKAMVHHAKGGVCEEAGELSSCLKRHVTYGQPLNRDNLVEELGDLRFYIQAVMNLFGISEVEVLQKNAIKLRKRYAELRYSDTAATARADKRDGEE